ncbi:hypothetical protein BC936DRAFT_149491 [Jimgerdemannia flammicorona]|uniref:Outer membrane protein Iml2/Tetratricopeptide repeat protein 39 n=1 Tax=Jimgerdemannia flammicorona TaxID=994334 RepID=A0A433DJZ0_9FUNG|nr:hypothetical protein BC936DRAFT_149491 [Jimgerdemannia flammicorona]
MTFHEDDIKIAIDTLTETYSLANAQIEAAAPKKPLKDSVSQYIATYYQFFTTNNTGLPATPPPLSSEEAALSQFLSNGVLRAHVVKAECCLLIAMMQLSQESIVGYLKCGLNLRRAYNSYSLVWQEYKKMGQAFNDHMDRDTISGIQFGYVFTKCPGCLDLMAACSSLIFVIVLEFNQFGRNTHSYGFVDSIGSVHLLLSTLPAKILKIVAAFGWKADKHLGFALLKLCLEGRRIRSPLASLMLLAYYTILTSFAPQVLAKEYTQPAIETLLDAQRNYPNSAFFLYFAGRTSRLARNISLSTQSYLYATEISRGEWAEVEVRHMCDYEIGFNHAMNLDWESASRVFESLFYEKYWSPAFCKYVHGACLEILGHRTEAILAFAQVPQLVVKKFGGRMIYIEQYVLRKVEFFQSSGYQDMDFSVPALELLTIWNCYEFMEREHLEKCLECVESALEKIAEREKLEYEIRIRELAPTTPPPNYFDQRGTLLLVKSAIQNALHRYLDSIVNLNWILDHKDLIKQDKWVVPFTYWEAGVTTWGLGEKAKSRKFWETALLCSKYEFEYRLAVRLNLGIMRCEEMGILKTEEKRSSKGPSTGGRKRMSVVTSTSSSSANRVSSIDA